MVKKNIEREVLQFARDHHLWQKGSHILAAVSGGPDSLGLLVLLSRLREEEGICLGCCVVNHHLRPEASEEAEYVRKVCRELQVPFFRKDIDVLSWKRTHGGSIETIARELRYEALFEVMKEGHYDLLATAHHKDDQAETVLYHLIRGSGIHGLTGIHPKRGSMIRPLLGVTKKEITSYVTDLGFHPCHDATNDIPDTDRNKIRLEILPRIKMINPQAVDALCRTADIVLAEDKWLDQEAERFMEQHALREEAVLFIRRKEWKKLPLALARRVIRRASVEVTGSGNVPDFEGMANMVRLGKEGKTGARASSKGMMLWVGEEDLVFFPGSTRGAFPIPLLLPAFFDKFAGKSVETLRHTGIMKENHSDREPKVSWHLDIRKSEKYPDHLGKNQYLLEAGRAGQLIVRHPRKGDLFHPKGLKEAVSLSKCLQSLKIPSFLRPCWPIVADEHQIYWIPPLRGSEEARPRRKEGPFLILTLSYSKN